MEIRKITYGDTKDWLLLKHYAHRMPSITYAFGLFVEGVLTGIVCYGSPPSRSLCKGLCGIDFVSNVMELNRLVINSDAPKNSASFLVGRSLRLLPRDAIIVSFADTAMNHNGYIYQATNFLYTGLSTKRTEVAIKGMEHMHSKSIVEKGKDKGMRNIDYLKQTYGDLVYYRERSRKHRYVFFRDKRMREFLRYPEQPYPKGESLKYDCIDIKEIK